MSVFEEVRKATEKLNEHISSSIKTQYRNRLENRKKDDEYYSQLSLDAKEAGTILHSSAFPRFRNYVDQTVKNLYKDLKNIWLSSNIDSMEQIKRSIQISAKIEMLETLRNRPQKLLDEIKKYSRED